MQITWSEINERAVRFVYEWKDAAHERAQAQTFWNDFFDVFGIIRKKVAAFEKHVMKLGQHHGFIDLFWPGTLIAEHKSAGRNLDSAKVQALDYFPGLEEYELPRYVIVTDFQRFWLSDLVDDKEWNFELADFPKHVHLFGFMIGHTPRTLSR